MLALLTACYRPPDLPPGDGVPKVAAPPPGCRDVLADQTVACTIDGDTFDMGACGEGGERFRMLGIDAPETEKPGQDAECGSQEAWDWLRDTIQGREITLSFDQTCLDVYGRSLAYVWARGDLYEDLASDPALHDYLWTWVEDPSEPAILLDEVMLGEGLARPFPEEIAGTLVFQDRLDRAAAEAQQLDRGLWSACPGG